eukprot:m.2931 g.2931  ORF g.2931 m.2931 type:complete len:383 (+) comp8982_c0_seq2:464-1612(+)
MLHHTVLVFVGVTLSVSLAATRDLQRHLFSKEQVESHGSRCLDGSPSGYYYQNGTEETSWVFFLEGGGFCDDQDSCVKRANTSLGSSKHWPSTSADDKGDVPGLLSTDPVANKDFYSWNHVYIPYCGGDVHSGQRGGPNDWNLYFAGHLTVKTVLSDLLNWTSLHQAKDVLVSGRSAGGIAAFEQADYFAEILHWASVKSAPIGGLFSPEGITSYDRWQKEEGPEPRVSFGHDLYQSFTQEACTKANPGKAYMCGPANIAFVYSYVKTPLFVIENQYDSYQLYKGLGCPENGANETFRFFAYYGEHMRATMETITNSSEYIGLFGPSCLAHIEDFGLPYKGVNIGNITYGESLGDWFFGRKNATYTRLMDQCKFPCNKSCKE